MHKRNSALALPASDTSGGIDLEPIGQRAGDWASMLVSAPGVAVFLVAAQCLWVGTSLFANTSLFPDAAEQFIWSKSLEWGYYKHPPLTTWVFAAAVAVLGAHAWVPSVVAGACMVATGVATWAVAKQLLGIRWAWFAAVLWSFQQWFSLRAYLYNHNTILVLTFALAACAAVHAVSKPHRRGRWVLVGLLAGLAMLSKYQAAIPLAGLVWAAWRSGSLQQASIRHGAWLAAGAAALVCLPHAIWLFEHDAPPVRYMAAQDHSTPFAERLQRLVVFSVFQLRTLMPALACVLAWLVAGHVVARLNSSPATVRARALASALGPAASASRRAWIEGLVLFPIIGIVASTLVGGLDLQAQWGMQTLQFASLPLLLMFARRLAATSAPLATAVALGAHLLFASIVTAISLNHAASWQTRENAVQYGLADALSRAVTRDWHATTACPLRYVVGPGLLASLVSAYSGEYPFVFEDGDPLKSPWIDRDKQREAGAIHLATRAADLPVEAIHRADMAMTAAAWRGVAPVVWGIVLPTHDCHAGAVADGAANAAP